MSDKASAEAERYARSGLGMAADEPNAATGFQERIVFADTVLHFTRGAEWQASRKAEAAPSDTGRSMDIIVHDILNDWPLTHRVVDSLISEGVFRAQPVQVEVTTEMVERAAVVLAEITAEPRVGRFERTMARAVLIAALGGGE